MSLAEPDGGRAVLIEGEEYPPSRARPAMCNGSVFRDCTFENLGDHWGLQIESTFLMCRFRNEDFCSALFNGVLFSGCTFENCAFRGVSLGDSTFVDCTFRSCVFTDDPDGNRTEIERARWFGCSEVDCKGLERLYLPSPPVSGPYR